MNYKDINDYEILYLIEDENDSYRNIIYDKYYGVIEEYIKKYKYKFPNVTIDCEDLKQEALLALNYAIDNFDESRGNTFYTFCIICIENRIKDYYIKLGRKKNYSNLNSISLNMEIGDEITLEDVVSSDEDICKHVLFNQCITDIINFKNSLLSEEAQVFELRINGFSYKEIAMLLDKNINNIYQYIRKIKKEYKSMLSKNGYCNF